MKNRLLLHFMKLQLWNKIIYKTIKSFIFCVNTKQANIRPYSISIFSNPVTHGFPLIYKRYENNPSEMPNLTELPLSDSTHYAFDSLSFHHISQFNLYFQLLNHTTTCTLTKLKAEEFPSQAQCDGLCIKSLQVVHEKEWEPVKNRTQHCGLRWKIIMLCRIE